MKFFQACIVFLASTMLPYEAHACLYWKNPLKHSYPVIFLITAIIAASLLSSAAIIFVFRKAKRNKNQQGKAMEVCSIFQRDLLPKPDDNFKEKVFLSIFSLISYVLAVTTTSFSEVAFSSISIVFISKYSVRLPTNNGCFLVA